MPPYQEQIIFGAWSEAELHALITASSGIGDVGRRIEYLSRRFLGVPYAAATLRGDEMTDEVLVVNLGAVDCFTLIDYVEAMRLSASFAEFRDKLRRVRYRAGIVAFRERNHFFSDWVLHNSGFVRDATAEIGGIDAVRAPKRLNKKDDGTFLIPGVDQRGCVVTYIPSGAMRGVVLDRLQTGDYAGMYSPLAGLDVSHVGIVVRRGPSLLFRHASSAAAHRKVVEVDLVRYVRGAPGVVVLRPEG